MCKVKDTILEYCFIREQMDVMFVPLAFLLQYVKASCIVR